MSGDETDLRLEMLDVVRGKNPRSSFWSKPQGSEAYFSGNGSQNIWLMRWMIQQVLGVDKLNPVDPSIVYAYQLGLETGHVLITRQGNPLVIPSSSLLPSDTQYSIGFGGSEFASTIYWFWHVVTHAAMMRKGSDERSRKLAEEWVVRNLLYFRAIEAQDSGILLGGQRSAGHDPNVPREMNWLYQVVKGESAVNISRAESWCKQAGAGLKQSWEFEIGKELLPELRRAWERAREMSIGELTSLLPLKTPTRIIKKNNSLVVVHSENVNPNTPPVLVLIYYNGIRMSLPDHGGNRIRQQFDHSMARIEEREGQGEVIYSSSLYTDEKEIRMPMPGGEIEYDIRLGEGEGKGTTVSILPVSNNASISSQPVVVDSNSNSNLFLSQAADILSSMILARKYIAKRDAIVSALRSGKSADSLPLSTFIDEIRSWYASDSKQVEAVKQRRVIELLTGKG